MIIAGVCVFFFFPDGLCNMIVLTCAAFDGVTSMQLTLYDQVHPSVL